MTFNKYEHAVAEYAKYPEKDSGSILALSYTALGLIGEAGEYSEKVKKLIRDGEFNKYEAAKELGDVLWYLTRCANELDLSLEDIAVMNIKKLKDRAERGVLQGNGDNR